MKMAGNYNNALSGSFEAAPAEEIQILEYPYPTAILVPELGNNVRIPDEVLRLSTTKQIETTLTIGVPAGAVNAGLRVVVFPQNVSLPPMLFVNIDTNLGTWGFVKFLNRSYDLASNYFLARFVSGYTQLYSNTVAAGVMDISGQLQSSIVGIGLNPTILSVQDLAPYGKYRGGMAIADGVTQLMLPLETLGYQVLQTSNTFISDTSTLVQARPPSSPCFPTVPSVIATGPVTLFDTNLDPTFFTGLLATGYVQFKFQQTIQFTAQAVGANVSGSLILITTTSVGDPVTWVVADQNVQNIAAIWGASWDANGESSFWEAYFDRTFFISGFLKRVQVLWTGSTVVNTNLTNTLTVGASLFSMNLWTQMSQMGALTQNMNITDAYGLVAGQSVQYREIYNVEAAVRATLIRDVKQYIQPMIQKEMEVYSAMIVDLINSGMYAAMTLEEYKDHAQKYANFSGANFDRWTASSWSKFRKIAKKVAAGVVKALPYVGNIAQMFLASPAGQQQNNNWSCTGREPPSASVSEDEADNENMDFQGTVSMSRTELLADKAQRAPQKPKRTMIVAIPEDKVSYTKLLARVKNLEDQVKAIDEKSQAKPKKKRFRKRKQKNTDQGKTEKEPIPTQQGTNYTASGQVPEKELDRLMGKLEQMRNRRAPQRVEPIIERPRQIIPQQDIQDMAAGMERNRFSEIKQLVSRMIGPATQSINSGMLVKERLTLMNSNFGQFPMVNAAQGISKAAVLSVSLVPLSDDSQNKTISPKYNHFPQSGAYVDVRIQGQAVDQILQARDITRNMFAKINPFANKELFFSLMGVNPTDTVSGPSIGLCAVAILLGIPIQQSLLLTGELRSGPEGTEIMPIGDYQLKAELAMAQGSLLVAPAGNWQDATADVKALTASRLQLELALMGGNVQFVFIRRMDELMSVFRYIKGGFRTALVNEIREENFRQKEAFNMEGGATENNIAELFRVLESIVENPDYQWPGRPNQESWQQISKKAYDVDRLTVSEKNKLYGTIKTLLASANAAVQPTETPNEFFEMYKEILFRAYNRFNSGQFNPETWRISDTENAPTVAMFVAKQLRTNTGPELIQKIANTIPKEKVSKKKKPNTKQTGGKALSALAMRLQSKK